MSVDPGDVRFARRASGLLAAFNTAGVLRAADVHIASALGRLGGEPDETVQLAAALAVRAVRLGAVCIDLADVRRTAASDLDPPVDLAALPWPEPTAWYAACRASRLVGDPSGPVDVPLRLVDDLLYLDRYWRQEQQVRAELAARADRPAPPVDRDRLDAALTRAFPAERDTEQRLAAAAAATGWVTLVVGGPGTGKTTTVARLLAVLGEIEGSPPRTALAAPTGKAAARLQQAVAEQTERLVSDGWRLPPDLTARTVHRLLGWRPGSHSRFRHHRDNRLPHDVVVIDETSMVSLTLMARLLEAVRPDARLVFVGDPDQLASVEAGAVLADLVHRSPRGGPDARVSALAAPLSPAAERELRTDVVRLRTSHRFGGAISLLAEAIRVGDADTALEVLQAGHDDVRFLAALDPLTTDGGSAANVDLTDLRWDVVAAGAALLAPARAGDVPSALDALDTHRLLCGHRTGPFGVQHWQQQVRRWLAEVDADPGPPSRLGPVIGTPLLVTRNDPDTGLANGDTGVVVTGPGGGPVAAFTRGGSPLLLPLRRLPDVDLCFAMTVHRAQGSQVDRVSVVLPPLGSPLLTRELFYTAVTRAQTRVRVLGSDAAVRAAIARPVVRASGLRGSPLGRNVDNRSAVSEGHREEGGQR